MAFIAHWDDATSETTDLGPIGGTWTDLGEAAGALRLGVNRVVVPGGKAATPQHAEDEEVFYVLGGSGFSVQEDGCFAIAEGDVVYYGASRPAHTVVAGDDGLEVIAFGTADPPRGVVRFPRIDRLRVAGHLLAGDHTHQWDLEARLERIEVSDPPDPRPDSIIHESEVEEEDFSGPRTKRLGRRVGARTIALSLARLDPGAESAEPHCHSMEEELFVILEGEGVLLLGPEEDEHAVRTGSIVGRPPATGVAHAFRAGARGMTVLMFSDKHPGDATYNPRAGDVLLRGLGVRVRAEAIAPR